MNADSEVKITIGGQEYPWGKVAYDTPMLPDVIGKDGVTFPIKLVFSANNPFFKNSTIFPLFLNGHPCYLHEGPIDCGNGWLYQAQIIANNPMQFLTRELFNPGIVWVSHPYLQNKTAH